ncbi:hypothetical protein [Ferruginibacter sp.]
MSTQTKSKLYLLIIGILLVTNIVMLFIFLKDGRHDSKPKPPRNNNDRTAMMRNFLKGEIGFDTVQLQQYDTLSKQFKERSRPDYDSLRNVKEQQFKELGAQSFSDSAIEQMAIASGDKQKQMEARLLNHFANIRKICRQDQLIKFDTSFYKMWSRKKKPEEKKDDKK